MVAIQHHNPTIPAYNPWISKIVSGDQSGPLQQHPGQGKQMFQIICPPNQIYQAPPTITENPSQSVLNSSDNQVHRILYQSTVLSQENSFANRNRFLMQARSMSPASLFHAAYSSPAHYSIIWKYYYHDSTWLAPLHQTSHYTSVHFAAIQN